MNALNIVLNMKGQNVLNPRTNEIIWKFVDWGDSDQYRTWLECVTNVDNIRLKSCLLTSRVNSRMASNRNSTTYKHK